jgi:alkylation response protein AidB-like acyl-CoA dehydrogenase
MTYAAPLKDMQFVLNELAGLQDIQRLPGCEEATPELVEAVLEEHAKFCSEVIAPLNAPADKEPGGIRNGEVETAQGFREAFHAFVEGGWQGLRHPQVFGGQSLPKIVATPCMEMLNAANLSFALCPLLTDGAIEALMIAGSESQKETYLHKLVGGQWTGTMNLTEPQAGSDLSLVRTRAEPQPDGTYKIFGTKIFITYGEHDMAENIVHLVLARTPDAPAGVKGISLFVVPKFLVNADGSLGARNDVHCVSLEHKLGIKASPTAVLQFGEQGGAIGTLVGKEHRGLETMFIMMNAARFAVGVQGVAVADRAYQQAVAYARERVQSRDPASESGEPLTIIHQPDVRRMLLSMRAQIEAARALAYVGAAAFDSAQHHPDEAVRRAQQAFYEYLVPIIKGWSTEMAIDVTSTGIQVHGGMGYIEETGAAQHYRDARILAIYEGTTAIQANDLVTRKTARDGGKMAKAILEQMRDTAGKLAASDHAALIAIGERLEQALPAYAQAVDFIVEALPSDPHATYAAAVPYLKLAGIVLGGWQMARAALAAENRLQQGDGDAAFLHAKISTARFFADYFLPEAEALSRGILHGSTQVMALDESQF